LKQACRTVFYCQVTRKNGSEIRISKIQTAEQFLKCQERLPSSGWSSRKFVPRNMHITLKTTLQTDHSIKEYTKIGKFQKNFQHLQRKKKSENSVTPFLTQYWIRTQKGYSFIRIKLYTGSSSTYRKRKIAACLKESMGTEDKAATKRGLQYTTEWATRAFQLLDLEPIKSRHKKLMVWNFIPHFRRGLHVVTHCFIWKPVPGGTNELPSKPALIICLTFSHHHFIVVFSWIYNI
jgi:hypothetical protein